MMADPLVDYVESIMIRPVETAEPTDTSRLALQKMVDKNIGCLVIVNEQRPVGIVTERDILRNIAKDPNFLKSNVNGAMSSPVIYLSPVAPINEAMETMLSYSIRRLPVVENGRLVGIVTERDLLHWVIKIANEPKIPPEVQEILRKPLASRT
jgi:CBS domain-containing protein